MAAMRATLLRTAPGVAALAALALTACAPEDDPAEFEEAEAASGVEEGSHDEGTEPAEADDTDDDAPAANEEPADEEETTDSDESAETSQADENPAPD